MNKKTKATVLLSIISGLICFVGLAILPIISISIITASQRNQKETFLFESKSPDNSIVLEAYVTEPGATVDYSIKVYVILTNEKRLVYNAYHERQASIDWIDNSNVVINGHLLNLSINEKYDWREG